MKRLGAETIKCGCLRTDEPGIMFWIMENYCTVCVKKRGGYCVAYLRITRSQETPFIQLDL